MAGELPRSGGMGRASINLMNRTYDGFYTLPWKTAGAQNTDGIAAHIKNGGFYPHRTAAPIYDKIDPVTELF